MKERLLRQEFSERIANAADADADNGGDAIVRQRVDIK